MLWWHFLLWIAPPPLDSTHPLPSIPPTHSKQSGGVHPTGMLSCFAKAFSGKSRISEEGLTYYFTKFRRKLHENEENWTKGVCIQHSCRPQRSCGKFMFLHPSVILFTGGVLLQVDTPLWADTSPWEQADTPPQDTATAADGTHPTGMHSCTMQIRYWLCTGCSSIIKIEILQHVAIQMITASVAEHFN